MSFCPVSYTHLDVYKRQGLIDSKELAAQMGKGAGLQMKNPLKVINEEYNDTRIDVYKRQVGDSLGH